MKNLLAVVITFALFFIPAFHMLNVLLTVFGLHPLL